MRAARRPLCCDDDRRVVAAALPRVDARDARHILAHAQHCTRAPYVCRFSCASTRQLPVYILCAFAPAPLLLPHDQSHALTLLHRRARLQIAVDPGVKKTVTVVVISLRDDKICFRHLAFGGRAYVVSFAVHVPRLHRWRLDVSSSYLLVALALLSCASASNFFCCCCSCFSCCCFFPSLTLYALLR